MEGSGGQAAARAARASLAMRASGLSGVPSTLIRQAVRDMDACRGDPGYRLEMGTWHKPGQAGEPCGVCLAGAVMAQTLEAPRGEMRGPGQYPEPIRRKMDALDLVRQGRVMAALHQLGRSLPDEVPWRREMPRFSGTEGDAAYQAFRAAVLGIAHDLEAAGA